MGQKNIILFCVKWSLKNPKKHPIMFQDLFIQCDENHGTVEKKDDIKAIKCIWCYKAKGFTSINL